METVNCINPTGKHEIPIISEIFSQGLIRVRLAGAILTPSSTLPAFSGNGRVQSVKGCRAGQCGRRDKNIWANIDGKASCATAYEADGALVVG